MKASKKFLSLLLVLAMVFSFAAISASAEPANVIFGGSSEPTGDQSSEPADSVEPDSGAASEPDTEPGADPEPSEEPKDEVTDPEASIVGEKKTYKYATLAEAIAAAADGATVQVNKDIVFSAPLTITKNVKLELAEATLTFKNSGTLYDAALVVDNGASVTLRNGEVVFVKTTDKDGNSFGFANGIVAEDGALKLRDVDVNGAVVGGSKLLANEDGSINVMGGEFDFDPSAYVDESYAATEADGVFTVAEKPAETQQPEESQQPEEQKPSNGPMKIVRPNQEGDKLTADKTEDLNVTADKTLDLAGFTLEGKITIADGFTLKLTNSASTPGTVKGSIEINGGALIIENSVVVTGDIVLKDNSGLSITSSGVEVKGDVKLADGAKADTIDGTVTAGKYKSLPAAFVPGTHEFKSGAVTEKAPDTAPTNTVKDASGNSYNTGTNYLQYFKGETELAPEQPIVYIDKASFVASSEPTAVKLGSKTLTKDTDYTWDGTKTLKFKFTETAVGTDKTKITAAAFEALNAGANEIVFEFASGDPVKVPLLVWPSVKIDNYKYLLGSKTDFTATVTDEPNEVRFDDTVLKETEDWTFADGKLTIKAAAMEKLKAGDRKLGFVYNDTNNPDNPGIFLNVITVRPAPSITPVDANKDNKWYNSGNALSYTVSPNVVSVAVDEKALDAANYSVSDKNVLSLKADFLKTLGYGKHKLAVATDDGNVSVEFTTGPSLVAKNGSNHTKGGSKDLTFVASDAMNAVYVGQTQLKSDYYTISSDGKTITLKASFLNTLKADNTYTITAAKLNSDGKSAQYSAATSFKILSAASAGATPKTGDTGIGLWVALLVISGAAMAVILPKQRKEN